MVGDSTITNVFGITGYYTKYVNLRLITYLTSLCLIVRLSSLLGRLEERKEELIAVLRCPDPRNNSKVQKALKQLGLKEKDYVLTTAFGASLSVQITGPWFQQAIRLLGIKEVLIINHRDCKAFQDRFGADEYQDHMDCLLDAKKWFGTIFPRLTTRLFIMPDDGQGNLIAKLQEIEEEPEQTKE